MRRLFIDFARVGDLVQLIPGLRLLARDGELDLLARAWARDLFRDQGWLAAVHGLARPNQNAWNEWLHGRPRRRLAATLSARAYDEILLFKGESPTVIAWLESWRGATPLRALTPPPHQTPMHMLAAHRGALADGGFDVAALEGVPRLDVDAGRLAAARARLAALGRRVVAVQAGSSLTQRWFRKQPNLKGLTPAQWAGLLVRLLEEGSCDAAVLLGSPPERREARAIIARLPPAWRSRVADWTSRVPLDELPAVLAAAHATISVDTGPAHIAAAVGCPLLVLFGPTNPSTFAPRGAGRIELLLGSAPCQFCHQTARFKTCRDNRCLNTLGLDALLAAWRRLGLDGR
jgi:heptosyltransferase-2/heptosyltransferase-3